MSIGHWSRLSLVRPQCGSLREGLSSRTTCRFSALMTPMRAIMVGPLSSTTRSRASTAACHSASCCSGLGELLDVFGGVVEGDELAAAGKGNRIVEGARPISHDATARTGPRRRRDEGSTISVYYGHACVAVLRHMRGRRSRGQIRREKGSGHSSRFSITVAVLL